MSVKSRCAIEEGLVFCVRVRNMVFFPLRTLTVLVVTLKAAIFSRHEVTSSTPALAVK